jgi:hypothetical protein
VEPSLTGIGIVCRGGGRSELRSDLPVYPMPPQEAQEVRRLRIGLRLGLRETAQALGLLSSELSGLETGTFAVDPGDWAKIREAIGEVAKAKRGGR